MENNYTIPNINKKTVTKKWLEKMNYIISRAKYDKINKWWRIELRDLTNYSNEWIPFNYDFSFVLIRKELNSKNNTKRPIKVLYIYLNWYLKGLEFFKINFKSEYENIYQINIELLRNKNYINTKQIKYWSSKEEYSQVISHLKYIKKTDKRNNKINHIFKKLNIDKITQIDLKDLDINILDILLNEIPAQKDKSIKKLKNLRDFLIHNDEYKPDLKSKHYRKIFWIKTTKQKIKIYSLYKNFIEYREFNFSDIYYFD